MDNRCLRKLRKLRKLRPQRPLTHELQCHQCQRYFFTNSSFFSPLCHHCERQHWMKQFKRLPHTNDSIFTGHEVSSRL